MNKNEKSQIKSDTKDLKAEAKKQALLKKKKIKKNITSGIAYVYSTFNNTIISIADESGNVVSWSSAGAKGFKVQENLHHTLHKLQQTMQVLKLLSRD